VNGTAHTDVRLSMERLRCALLYLTGASGAIVLIEPNPYEVMSLLTLAVFHGHRGFAVACVPADPVSADPDQRRLLHFGRPIVDKPGIVTWLATSGICCSPPCCLRWR
jgi:hypothetical protein